MSTDTITIYATYWCPFCQKLRSGLDAAGIPYTLIDVDENEEAGLWVESVNDGNRVVPTVRYSDGSYKTNPPVKQVIRRYAELVSAPV